MVRRTESAYPFPGGRPRVPTIHRIRAAFRAFGDLFPGMRYKKIRIQQVGKAFRALNEDDVALITLTHNDKRLLQPFLTHYRQLGVTRFLIVDDRSTDGTKEFLSQEPDVDLYESNCRYSDAYRGRAWRQILVNRYGRGRWYLNVDSDEFLVFAAAPSLPQLISWLEKRGIRHMPAPMLDMYPPGYVEAADYAFPRDGMPWTIASLVDEDGYDLRAGARAWSLKGGVRQRFFQSKAELMKYPLMHWDSLTRLDKSIHFPNPYWRNFSAPAGALLHFKFFSGFSDDFAEVVRNGQHFGGGQIYQDILEKIQQPAQIVLETATSITYTGARKLARMGFFSVE